MKLLLVDDEQLLLDSLERSVDWESEGITLVGKATDGEAALRLCGENCPDVVITDIGMSPMDGLELTKRLRAQYPGVKIVLMSSYSNFEYAQQAITLGVSSYLLKLNTTPQDMVRTIRRIGQELRRPVPDGPPPLNDRFQQALGCMKGELPPNRAAELLNALADCEWVMVGAGLPEGEDAAPRGEELYAALDALNPHGLNAVSARHCYLYLPLEEGGGPLRNELNRVKIRLAAQLGDSSLCASEVVARDEIGRAFSQVKQVLARCFFEDKHTLLQWDEGDAAAPQPLPAPYNEFIHDAATGNCALLRQKLSAFLQDRERLRRIGRSQLLGMMEHIFLLLRDTVLPGEDDELLAAIRSIGSLTYLDDLRHVADWLLHRFSAAEQLPSYSPVVARCIQYIRAHYDQPLSLSVLAAELHVSAPYLSKLFIQDTGSGITEYILHCKMEYAKSMLLHQPDLEIKQLAIELSIDSASYFTHLFRKYAGCSPTEFRRSARELAS